jgi:hypothetical protein
MRRCTDAPYPWRWTKRQESERRPSGAPGRPLTSQKREKGAGERERASSRTRSAGGHAPRRARRGNTEVGDKQPGRDGWMDRQGGGAGGLHTHTGTRACLHRRPLARRPTRCSHSTACVHVPGCSLQAQQAQPPHRALSMGQARRVKGRDALPRFAQKVGGGCGAAVAVPPGTRCHDLEAAASFCPTGGRDCG